MFISGLHILNHPLSTSAAIRCNHSSKFVYPFPLTSVRVFRDRMTNFVQWKATLSSYFILTVSNPSASVAHIPMNINILFSTMSRSKGLAPARLGVQSRSYLCFKDLNSGAKRRVWKFDVKVGINIGINNRPWVISNTGCDVVLHVNCGTFLTARKGFEILAAFLCTWSWL